MKYRIIGGAIRQEIEMDVQEVPPLTKGDITITGPFVVRVSWHLSVDNEKPGITVTVIGDLVCGGGVRVQKSLQFDLRDEEFPEELTPFVEQFGPDFNPDLVLPNRVWGEA